MDFAIVGLGVGALAILIGLGARQLGPVLWSIRHDQPLSPAALASRVAMLRFTLAGGLILALAGALLLLVTIIAIGLGLPDRTGAIVIMIGITLGVIACVAWGVTYARRYHPRPLPPSPLRQGALRPPAGFAPPRTATASRANAGPNAAVPGSANIAATAASSDDAATPDDVTPVPAPDPVSPPDPAGAAPTSNSATAAGEPLPDAPGDDGLWQDDDLASGEPLDRTSDYPRETRVIPDIDPPEDPDAVGDAHAGSTGPGLASLPPDQPDALELDDRSGPVDAVAPTAVIADAAATPAAPGDPDDDRPVDLASPAGAFDTPGTGPGGKRENST